MEETVKRESIYNVPTATALHTSSPAVTASQQRAERTPYFSSGYDGGGARCCGGAARSVRPDLCPPRLRLNHDQTREGKKNTRSQLASTHLTPAPCFLPAARHKQFEDKCQLMFSN